MADYHEFHGFVSPETELYIVKTHIIHALAETASEAATGSLNSPVKS